MSLRRVLHRILAGKAQPICRLLLAVGACLILVHCVRLGSVSSDANGIKNSSRLLVFTPRLQPDNNKTTSLNSTQDSRILSPSSAEVGGRRHDDGGMALVKFTRMQQTLSRNLDHWDGQWRFTLNTKLEADKKAISALNDFQVVCSQQRSSTNVSSSPNSVAAVSCPCISGALQGRHVPNVTNLMKLSWAELEALVSLPHADGVWRPPNCVARRRLAVIVPCRDREVVLRAFLAHMHPLLQRQLIEYRIFVVEQMWPAIFNKAAMMNAGFLEVQKLFPADCVLFHDVDLLIEDDRAIFHCKPGIGLHFGGALDRWKYKPYYSTLFGGAVVMTPSDVIRVNGYSNEFFGWGKEDDEFSIRIRAFKMKIERPKLAFYTSIRHERDVGNAPGWFNGQLADTHRKARSYDRDGLTTLRYESPEVELKPLYTWVKVRLIVNDSAYHFAKVSSDYDHTAGDCPDLPPSAVEIFQLSLISCRFRCDLRTDCLGFLYYEHSDNHCHLMTSPCPRNFSADGVAIYIKKAASQNRAELTKVPDGFRMVEGHVEGKVSKLLDVSLETCVDTCKKEAGCDAITFGELPRRFCSIKLKLLPGPVVTPDANYGSRSYIKMRKGWWG